MKIISLLLVVAFLFTTSVSAEETYGILGFKSTNITDGELEYIGAILENSLSKKGNQIISISDREKILDQIKFSFSGVTEEDQSGSDLENLAANHLIAGVAGILSDKQAYIVLKKIDTVSGQTESTVRRLEKNLPAIIDNMDQYADALLSDNPVNGAENKQLLPDRFIDQKDPYKLVSAYAGLGFFSQQYNYTISGADGRLGFTSFSSEQLGLYVSFDFGYIVSMDYHEYGTEFSWSNIHFSHSTLFGLGYRFELLSNLVFVPAAGALLSAVVDIDTAGGLNLTSLSVGAATDLNLYYYLNDSTFLQLQLKGGIIGIPLATLTSIDYIDSPDGFGKLISGLVGGVSIGIGFAE